MPKQSQGTPNAGVFNDDIEQYAVKRVQPDYPMLAQKHKIEEL
jgi:hypothetical protein